MDTVYVSYPDGASVPETRMPGFRLSQGALWSRQLGTACPVKLKVQKGRVWVTEENDPRDYLLNEGQTFETRTPGLIIAEALESAVVSIQIEGGQNAGAHQERHQIRLANFR